METARRDAGWLAAHVARARSPGHSRCGPCWVPAIPGSSGQCGHLERQGPGPGLQCQDVGECLCSLACQSLNTLQSQCRGY